MESHEAMRSTAQPLTGATLKHMRALRRSTTRRPTRPACSKKGYRYLWTKVLQDPVPATTSATNQSDDDEWFAQHEANDDAQRQAQWQQQMAQGNDDEQASMDAANASYAAEAAQAAANVSAAASFDAQMTVGN